MTAFQTAMDTLFNDPNLGADASYQPLAGGAPFAVRVIQIQPDDQLIRLPGALSVVSTGNVFEVRQSDVAQPAPGDALTIGTVTYTVQGKPAFNQRRGTWCLDTYS